MFRFHPFYPSDLDRFFWLVVCKTTMPLDPPSHFVVLFVPAHMFPFVLVECLECFFSFMPLFLLEKVPNQCAIARFQLLKPVVGQSTQ